MFLKLRIDSKSPISFQYVGCVLAKNLLILNIPGFNGKNIIADKRRNYQDVEICSVHFILKSYIPMCFYVSYSLIVFTDLPLSSFIRYYSTLADDHIKI